jgi:hypothetical protein
MRKVITQLKRGASFNELMTADGLLDTTAHEGLIFIDGLNRVAGRQHFRTFAVARLVGEALLMGVLPPALEEQIFAASLETPWGVLGLFGRNYSEWLRPHKTRFRPFLHAALATWKELDAVGPRYSSGVSYGSPLWEEPNNLHFVLANMGVPTELLSSPLPPEGPAALLRYATAAN